MNLELAQPTGRYYTTREAASALGISHRTAQLWVEAGRLEAWKTCGGHRRISVESVERLQAERAGRIPAFSPAAPQTGDRLRLLVVDETPISLRYFKAGIDGWGLPIDAHYASNSYEALILIGRDSPDLLITELRMPGLDGIQMLHSIARSPFREGMEIIVVTARNSDEILRDGGLPEGVRVFGKPAPLHILRQIAAELLARRQALSHAAQQLEHA
jgi:excisionase family DNA binding protein